jgi:hypothetical protein
MTVRVVQEIPSAQQRVLVLQYYCSSQEEDDTTTKQQNGTKDHQQLGDDCWNAALEAGRQHAVLRIWKGVKRWWNLNHVAPATVDQEHQERLQNMARQEIWGYRMARQAFHHHHHRSLHGTNLRIPTVLYFSLEHDDNNNNNNNNNHKEEPWALLEYVGEQSTLFGTARVHDPFWTQSMIPMRDEFGFVEPHPRWGRVPVENALEYAQIVLQQVILPLHQFYYDDCHPAPAFHNSTGTTTAQSYVDVVANCRQKYTQFLLHCQQRPLESAAAAAAIHEPEPSERAAFLQDCTEKLDKAISVLEHAVSALDELQLLTPPVLCHMDLQPQNMLFAAPRLGNGANNSNRNDSIVVSVLDWEEAAYADPRFELLLLGRKVCANRLQAESIWQMYQTKRRQWSLQLLGPLEPWLRLETVHSLTTLLLQATNTAGGGRSPWETWDDLRGKLEREWQRWNN